MPAQLCGKTDNDCEFTVSADRLQDARDTGSYPSQTSNCAESAAASFRLSAIE
jgi:hypothetical protein